MNPNLLPFPRSVKIFRSTFTLPGDKPLDAVKISWTASASNHPQGYTLVISKKGIEILCRQESGLRAAVATLRQLLRQYHRRLPCLKIRDWPDFPRRGVMLDISRGRVPKLETLFELAEKLADFKINELQLYTEHTYAYRKYKSVWQSWGALTGAEIRRLDAHCRELGIDLVPNQNSFGHLRYFLEHPRVRKLAEVAGPHEDPGGEFVRRPTTLAPNHPGTLPFLRGLYDELLPNFSSRLFNAGCDETWDLGLGQSRKLCAAKGKGRVYLDFLKKVHREVSARGRVMMLWGDIILKYPKLISELARSSRRDSAPLGQSGLTSAATNIIALNWGYESNHPFEKEAGAFAKAKIPFYVCPGTSSWQTLIGRHDNALANLRSAARAGCRHGAIGYLITDWGDGGHPQPPAVSWPMLLAGASLAWNSRSFQPAKIIPVLSRDVFKDPTGRIAGAAFKLGFAHRKLRITTPNETPLGTVIAAPRPEERELFCRYGLKWFTRISAKNIRATLKEIERQRVILQRVLRARSGVSAERRHLSNSKTAASRRYAPGAVLATELDLAARMAAQSCKFMLWQQAVAAGRTAEARKLAQTGLRELRTLEKEFNSLWPARNKGTPAHCSAFLRWRMDDYRRGSVA